MDHQRRVLLRALGAGLGLGSAGCLSRGQTQNATDGGTETPVRDPDRSVEDTPTGDTVAEQSEPEATEQSTMTEAETRLVETTDRIMNELAWFATEYQGALNAYRDAGESVTTAVGEVGETVPFTDRDVRRLDGEIDRPRMDRGWPYDIWWEKSEKRWRRVPIDWQAPGEEATGEVPLDGEEIERLRDETAAFSDTFERRFEPHFLGAEKERQFATETIDVIETFSDRNDTAMVVAGLVRLFQHYQTLTSETYVNATLSANPIRNRLVEYLTAPGLEGGSVTPLFGLSYRGRDGHSAYAHRRTTETDRTGGQYQSEPAATIDGSTRDSSRTKLQTVVAPLEVGAGRVDRCYCVVTDWSDAVGEYVTAALPSQPIVVQRYDDAGTARDASRRLFERERITRLESVDVRLRGDVNWQPMRFPYETESWYAVVSQVGRHLLTTGIGKRPFEHRGLESSELDWRDPLALSWLWGSATQEEQVS